MENNGPIQSLKHSIGGWVALMFLFATLAACAPTTPVYIPPEWQAPPQRSGAQVKPQAPPAAAQQPILKPAPEIKEMNVSQAPETSAAAQSPSQKPVQPQQLASMHLVDQAEAALAQANANQAITVLEQAIQVDVYNGQAFYDLAQAWHMKGSLSKALEFANKAEILFQNDPAKLKNVYVLKAEIYQDMGDTAKAESYRQKAARF